MIQEYLLQDNAERESIQQYNPVNTQKSLFSAGNSDVWFVQFSVDGENEAIAKQLSEIDEHMRSTFHVSVLENGCSAYFGKRLYPLVSEFEYKLRKILYLTSALNRDGKTDGLISDLESKDFGQIFSLLFIDSSFMSKVKDEVKSRNRDYFSKADVLASIETIEEVKLWDSLVGKDAVPTLQKHFTEVRDYRNDVMHSQHLSWAQFREMLGMFKRMNKELNAALHKIEIAESKTPSKPTFNQMLESALRVQEQWAAMGEAMSSHWEQIQRVSSLKPSPELIKTIEMLNQLTRDALPRSDLLEVLNRMNEKPKPAEEYLPVVQNLQELVLGTTARPSDISPEKASDANQHVTRDSATIRQLGKKSGDTGSNSTSNEDGGHDNG
ncbi:MAG: hypothetical protein IJQ42_07730 [Oscillospiraceae bacterium]|nr:hypothetical protein [Oscillospiraceae bacterium]